MRWYGTVGTVLLWASLSGDAFAQTPRDKQEKFVAAAREVLGIPYQFGGRMRRPGEGIDCQGVLFYAAERVSRRPMKAPSPTEAAR